MLLLNMTHEEVRNEIIKDLPNVQRYEEHLKNGFRRKSLKMKEFPKYLFTEYTSPRKNLWLISTKFYSKGKFGSTFGVLQVQNGLVLHQAFVSSFESDFSVIVTFIPHFFERYAKYNNLNLKGKELIKKVLRDDCSFNIDKTNFLSGRKDRDKENNAHACMKHGVGMGYEVGYKHLLMKTYITYDMSFGKQKAAFESMRDNMNKVLSGPATLTGPIPVDYGINESLVKKLKRKLGIK